MRPYLRPLSFLYDQIVGVKNSLYDRGVIEAYKAPIPVISIGNLTVGGTGKTPLTDFCLKYLVQAGRKVAVVSRSYRADAQAPCWVDVSHPFGARYYGDEPLLLAQANPEVAVFVGSTKWRTAEYAVRKEKYDVVIVDDGFQHRKLQRDLNIVILDATEDMANYEVVPEGRARESWAGLERADLIVLTKCNLADEANLKALEAKLPKNKEVLYFGYDIRKFWNQKQSEFKSREELQGKKLFLVSAIARPDVFEKMMREIGEVSKKSLHFRDHHQYTENDARQIVEEFEKSQCDYLITTEKDAVKLRPLMPKTPTLWSASLEVAELGKKGRLYEVISEILSSAHR
ncbi:tetraacyldisaccharide 4'-kinase [Bdellovibrio svalbardensis]|uniref:Tetraacyldisaccharide 4'-kinase n=1 Tax=Bdellovibrio svalbardensis TaxID=2972972 RepID=A0ABT6DN60_9BACT|nr:tetraacyldisaccharide 4'-kinase [Bdellovibrio svalbardensis]MDG0817535.1 tetraacyldisaccharide 4'-kinase [Bdellovibrio svalbardensis]